MILNSHYRYRKFVEWANWIGMLFCTSVSVFFLIAILGYVLVNGASYIDWEFLTAMGLLLAWVFSRHLSRRFRRLVQFSGQVAAGSFPQNFFPDSGSDEIALLEGHLNEMSLHLRANLSQVIEEKEKADSILRCMPPPADPSTVLLASSS